MTGLLARRPATYLAWTIKPSYWKDRCAVIVAQNRVEGTGDHIAEPRYYRSGAVSIWRMQRTRKICMRDNRLNYRRKSSDRIEGLVDVDNEDTICIKGKCMNS